MHGHLNVKKVIDCIFFSLQRNKHRTESGEYSPKFQFVSWSHLTQHTFLLQTFANMLVCVRV